MAVALTKPWDASIENNVRDFSQTLSEKDRRRFAAVQARQLGYGGVRYVAEIVDCSRRTIENSFWLIGAAPHRGGSISLRPMAVPTDTKVSPIPSSHSVAVPRLV